MVTKWIGTRNPARGRTNSSSGCPPRRKVLVVHALENGPRRAGADDGREADGGGAGREQGAERPRREEQAARPAQPRGEGEQARRQARPGPQCAGEKQRRAQHDPSDTRERRCPAGVGGRDETADDGEDHEPEHVVDHGGAGNDPRFRAPGAPEVAQHAGLDPDARGGERTPPARAGESGIAEHATPASNSPSTAGCPARRTRPPVSLAAARNSASAGARCKARKRRDLGQRRQGSGGSASAGLTRPRNREPRIAGRARSVSRRARRALPALHHARRPRRSQPQGRRGAHDRHLDHDVAARRDRSRKPPGRTEAAARRCGFGRLSAPGREPRRVSSAPSCRNSSARRNGFRSRRANR